MATETHHVSHEKQEYNDEKTDLEVSAIHLDEEEDSAIEEVRVTVSNKDDPLQPCNTFRMWFLGLFFTIVISFVNQFFFMRQTIISLGYSVVALLSLPLGHLMARSLPTREFSLFGYQFSLNPGPFSLKEHVLIGTMAACSSQSAYAVDIVILQRVFYHDHKPFLAGLLLVITTQVTGFALAGALRKILVRPAHMIWPSTLVSVALFRSLHSIDTEQEKASGKMSRMRFFMLVTLGSFIWYWFPGFIFPGIGVLSWICWIKPDNVILSQLTGSNGLGIGTIALDWSALTSAFAPLATPLFAQVNILIGFVAVAWIIVPIAYYNNLWFSKNFPIISAALYLENGLDYDKDQILTNSVLVQEKYDAYGPMRMSSFFALTYGIGFAGLTATVVHVYLYHGKEILARLRSARVEEDDIHSKLMRAYPEVPDWWYISLFVIMLALSLVTCVVYDYMPWWAVLLAIAIAIFFVLPVGIVQAVTNQQPGLNIITEYVIGYMLPGHAIANVTFKTYGYIVNVQALTFASDLKLGHYCKIPPRIMFMVQLLSTIISGLVNLLTSNWLIDSRPDICTAAGKPFTCRYTKTFYSASIIWGAIGPARVFGSEPGALYSPVQWGFVIGAILPLIFWLAAKKFPNSEWLKNVHIPVLLAATSLMPPNLPYMYTNALAVGFFFMWYLRKYHVEWWSRYNYLTSAALDTGVAVSGVVIYFAVQSWDGAMPVWWGNAEVSDHCPLGGMPFNPLPDVPEA